MVLKLGILASTRGTDMQAIIDAIEQRQLDAEIAIVVSDNRHAGALERAHRHGIEAQYLNPNEFEDKEAFDRKIAEWFGEQGVELVLLIGYNRIVREPLIQHYRNRILNIHPSLLPEFAGAFDTNVHARVLEEGRKETGCTLHIVTEEVDAGPIVRQKKVSIAEGETIESLKEKVQQAEQDIILEILRKWAAGKVHVREGKVVMDD